MNRTYPQVSLEDVITAAEKVLRLADRDFEFRHTTQGFVASRSWSIYLLFGDYIR